MSRFLLLILSLAVFVLLGSTTRADDFMTLGDIPDGVAFSRANGVSDDGTVVAGRGTSASGIEASRWTAVGGMVGLGDLPGGEYFSKAFGLSADGNVVVGISRSAASVGFDEAFRWTAGTGMVGLGDFPGGDFFSQAWGVSADGSVVVGQGVGSAGPEAFRWTAGSGLVGLGDLQGGGFTSIAYAVSDDGNVVVGRGWGGSGTEAFRWTAGGGMVGLGDLPGGQTISQAWGVSDDGNVVVGYGFSSSGQEAFRWTADGGMIGLGDLPGGSHFSHAYGVSADGDVVVGWGTVDGGNEAFIWTPANGMENLRDVLIAGGATGLENWTLADAWAVSGDGQWIVGIAKGPMNATEAYLARRDIPYNGRFKDVPPAYWAFSFIETLADSGITAGCGNDNYCPTGSVTRAQMAVFLERGMRGSNYSPPAATGNVFQDVSAGDFAASFIEQLAQDGITSGCGNNNYCPDGEVTRDQMAVFLLRAKHGSGYSPPAATGVFNDVPLSHWAVHWIEQLAAEGITAGCGEGNYCPDATVNRDQMAVFLVRTFGL